jgi:hypothetical protein
MRVLEGFFIRNPNQTTGPDIICQERDFATRDMRVPCQLDGLKAYPNRKIGVVSGSRIAV